MCHKIYLPDLAKPRSGVGNNVFELCRANSKFESFFIHLHLNMELVFKDS